MNKFPERLKQLRTEKGLKVTDIREALGLKGNNSYYFYEGGQREPKLDNLIRLADIFGVTVDYLVGHDTLTANTYKVKITKKRA